MIQRIDIYELLPHKKKCCYFQYSFGSFVKAFYCGLSADEWLDDFSYNLLKGFMAGWRVGLVLQNQKSFRPII